MAAQRGIDPYLFATERSEEDASAAEPNVMVFLERKARLGTHGKTINWAHIVGGIAQAALHNRHDEVKARAWLGVACAEQVAIDVGSWAATRQVGCRKSQSTAPST